MSSLAFEHSGSSHVRLWGIACAIVGTAFFATLDTTSQLVGMAAPVLMVQWIRYSMQTLATSAMILPTRGLGGLRTHSLGLQLLRCLLMMASTGMAFISLRYVPVGDFTAIVMLIPLLVTLISMVVLKEKVSALRWALVLGSFVGTLIIVHPGQAGFQMVWLLPLLVAVAGTAFQVLTARMMRTEDGTTTHWYSGLFGMLITTCALPFVWQSLPPRIWALLLLIALASTAGHMLLIMAYQRAGAVLTTAYQYCQIGFAMLGGWVVFGRVPDAWALVGIGMIVLCGVLGAWLTLREGRASTAPQVLDT